MNKLSEVRAIVWHHSATPSGSVEAFRREHKKRGFQDIGYHYLIGNGQGEQDGAIVPGRSLKFEGAGVFGNNRGFVHVCVVGNFEHAKPTPKQLVAIGALQLKIARDWGTLSLSTYGHREVAIKGHATLCPGKNFPLAALRNWFTAGNFRTPLHDFLAAQETMLARKRAEDAAAAAASAPEPALIALVEPEGAKPQGRDCKIRFADGTIRRMPAVIYRDKTYFGVRDIAQAMGWHIDYDDHEVILHVP